MHPALKSFPTSNVKNMFCTSAMKSFYNGSCYLQVAGMNGLGCEVAKNLVLAGVNTMTVIPFHPIIFVPSFR
jgi:molybdopterin/thiamine biosynthesis adenylyltransferase